MRRALYVAPCAVILACGGSGAPSGASGSASAADASTGIDGGGANGSTPPTTSGDAATVTSSSDASITPRDAGVDATTGGADSGIVASYDAAAFAVDGGPSSSFLPVVSGTCPTITTGTLTFAGQQVQLFTGESAPATPGPLVIFWFPTGGSSIDVIYFFGQAQIDAVTAAGGIVASVATSNKQGTNTGDDVWYTGDFETTDQVVACALQQHWLDPTRIFVTGASAGGLQSTWMAYARSGYVAANAPISGGLAGYDGFYAAPTTSPQDPTNVPSAIVTHGALGVDVLDIDFAVASAAYEADIATKGGVSVDCNTDAGHVSGPPQICPAIWQYFEDHPFKVKDSYASGLPSSFPSYCQVGPRLADGGAP